MYLIGKLILRNNKFYDYRYSMGFQTGYLHQIYKIYIRITGENGISIMPNPLHKLSNTKKIL